MNSVRNIISTPLARRTPFYCIEAFGALAALCVFGCVAESLPPLAIAVIWAVASSVCAVAFLYPCIVKKRNTCEMYRDGSFIANRINGRALRYCFCFALSAVLIAGLMIESQKWDLLEWAIAVAAVPLYLVVALCVDSWISRREYKPFYRARGTMLISWAITGVILTALYLVAFLGDPANNHATFGEAFSATKLLFDNSPSAALATIGQVGYLTDGLMEWGISNLSQANPLAAATAATIAVVLRASSAFALAHIMSACSLAPSALKATFKPIEGHDTPRERIKTPLLLAATIVVAGAALVGGFSVAEQAAGAARSTDGYSALESLVREDIKLSVYETETGAYDADTVERTVSNVLGADPELEQKHDALVQAIDDAYEACRDNVDGYLDWHFQDWFIDFGRTANNFFNPSSDRIHQEFRDHVLQGVDTGAIEATVHEYDTVLGEIKAQVESELAALQVYDIPSWLVFDKHSLDERFQEISFDGTLVLLDPQGDYFDRDTYRKAIFEAIDASCAEMIAEVG